MSAQKVATGVVLAALAALLLSVGMPALLAPEQVPTIQITNPVTGADDGSGGADEPSAEPPPAEVPPARTDDDDTDDTDDDDDGGDDGPGDDGEDGPDDDDRDDDD